MSECLHIHDEAGHDVGYVCRSGPFKYQAAVHQAWSREWEPIGNATNTIAGAFRVLGKSLEENRQKQWPRYNRAGIWAIERGISYYEPHQIYEVRLT